MKKQLFTVYLICLAALLSQAQVLPHLSGYGGDDSDRSHAIAVDNDGNMYITGGFTSPVLDFGGGVVLDHSGGSGMDAFVAAFNAAGLAQWAISAENPNANAYGNDIVVDDSYVYIIGSYDGDMIQFDGGPSLAHSGESDFFVACFTKTDGGHEWSFTNDDMTAPASLNEFGNGISIFNSKLVFTGSFNSEYLGLFDTELTNSGVSGTYDVFIGIGEVTGGTFVLEQFIQLSGGGNDHGMSISSEDDILYLSGHFDGDELNFLSSTGPDITLDNTGGMDVFTARYKITDETWSWATNPDGENHDFANAVKVHDEFVYLTGGYMSPELDFGGTAGMLVNPVPDWTDYYLVQYDKSTGTANWSQTADANLDPWHNFDDYGNDLAVDLDGNVYVTGWYKSFLIDFGSGPIQNITDNDYAEVFVAKYENDGSLLWAISSHGVGNDLGMGIAIKDDCVAITGLYESNPFEFGGYSFGTAIYDIPDFYVGYICTYDCQPGCDHPFLALHTGTEGIGEEDPDWWLTVDPMGGTVPRAAIGSIWHTDTWSYGPPFVGTNWISIDEVPFADLGVYVFERYFEAMPNDCDFPSLHLCILADDEVEVFINETSIGMGGDITEPFYLSVDDPGWAIFNPDGPNTLRVDVHNTIPNQMAFNLKGWVCCDTTTSIGEAFYGYLHGVKIYPVPVHDELHISSPVVLESFDLYRLTGEHIRSESIEAKSARIDMGNLPAGMYFLRLVKADGKVITRKVIRQ